MQLNSVSNASFKLCVGEFVTGVTVVTTIDDSGYMHGITVNSFNSVSLNPPMILFSVEKTASRFKIFNECREFIVNVLSEKQKTLSQAFAKKDLYNWNDYQYIIINNIPVIDGIISYIYCSTQYVYEGGDHKIIVGKVINCQKLTNDKPLLYYQGRYRLIGGQCF
ncbi:flavin reductase family protein [Neoehrlichia mikurensis]|uniref:Flavin reductase family protein n=1 Tax=Neoehrlichia mikurensis TaxID=89586 RepID=A0A9Q9F4T8_9RICK|nr:flavin reductase family protein [Neoehrlichia mikurensis]QXK92414.1 flavin reductase family protein [Neoehrlichia mikurensis]QXK93259.1 flavin reductase family protein [Neoehrlichia mikurensis]QXK94106.1 flavin reductase family protein [Neoehrlichia mikurensis]UTO55983.1 flavin reductase family protein [Neoehrlichia mikurensis]UTO56898.1 flavin reductase family protein [Neoehrlichia mikurensis]